MLPSQLVLKWFDYILEVAVYLILVRQPFAQAVFAILAGCSCVLVVDTFAASTRMLFGVNLPALLFELMLYPLMVVLVCKMRKPLWEVSSYIKSRIWPLALVQIILIACFILLVLFPVPIVQAPGNIPAALMLCAATVSMYALILFMFRELLAQNKSGQSALAMQIYASSLERQNYISSHNAKMAGIFRHDLRHITQMALSCLNSGDIPAVRELLLNIDNNVSTGWSEPYIKEFTGHNLIDATLSHYMAFAKESGIDITVEMNLMNGINADKTELAVVLANALENAVNACEGISEEKKRIIRVNGRRRGRQFFLEIANTCEGEVRFEPETGLPISGREEHGIGSQSTAVFAQKYDAELEYSQSESWFYLRLLLQLAR